MNKTVVVYDSNENIIKRTDEDSLQSYLEDALLKETARGELCGDDLWVETFPIRDTEAYVHIGDGLEDSVMFSHVSEVADYLSKNGLHETDRIMGCSLLHIYAEKESDFLP